MTVSALIDEILVRLRRDTALAANRTRALTWLNLSKDRLCRAKAWPWTYGRSASGISTVATEELAALPANYYRLHLLVINTSGYRRKLKELEEWDHQTVDPAGDGTGTPSHWRRAEPTTAGIPQVRFEPIPDRVYAMDVWGWRTFADETDAAALTSPAVPVQYHDLLIEGAVAIGFAADDDVRADRQAETVRGLIEQAKIEDKTTPGALRVQSWSGNRRARY